MIRIDQGDPAERAKIITRLEADYALSRLSIWQVIAQRKPLARWLILCLFYR